MRELWIALMLLALGGAAGWVIGQLVKLVRG
jgi:hypothetical protein